MSGQGKADTSTSKSSEIARLKEAVKDMFEKRHFAFVEKEKLETYAKKGYQLFYSTFYRKVDL